MKLRDLFFQKLEEAKKELGSYYNEPKMSDPHIKQIIKHLSEMSNIPEDVLAEEIEKQVKQMDEGVKSEILDGTAKKNHIETALFRFLDKIDKTHKDSPKFSIKMFKKLWDIIIVEEPELFPMISIESRKARYPKMFLVPSVNNPEYNSVTTAAATKNAEFIFNEKFMQQLIDFAYMKDIQPKGIKYSNNGGDIDKNYAYLEFLILHEFMHYTRADWHYEKKYGAKAKIINYVGDYRTNHELVRLGLEQLPIGLFSEHVNLEKQKTYKEMLDLVTAEMEKYGSNQDSHDDHSQSGESEDGEGSEGEQGDNQDGEKKDSKGEKPGKGSGKGEKSDDKSDEKKDGEKGEGSSDAKGSKEISQEDLDELDREMKRTSEKLSKRQEVATHDEAKKRIKERDEAAAKGDGNANVSVSEVPLTKITWIKLLKKLADKTFNSLYDDSYQKPDKRSITSAVTASQGIPGVVKPGEVITDETRKKLVLVIDSSGSMMEAISLIHSQLNSYINSKANSIAHDDFYIVKFSDSYKCYKCSFKNKVYKEVPLEEIYSNKETTLSKSNDSILTLFKKTFGSSTNLSSTLVAALIDSTKKGNSVILFSDTDILYGQNKQHLSALLVQSNKSSVGLVFDSLNSFKEYFKDFGNKYSSFVTCIQ